MANKAIVSKIQKSKYISDTGKKPVYPVTLDEAVKVKKEDGKTYTTLVNALNSKFGDAIVLGFWQDLSAEERVQEYYMFTLRYGKDMDGKFSDSINYKEALITALTCSNEDFIDLCLANDDEEGAEINETLQPQTVASLQNRIRNSKYLNTLYLRMIHLHGTDIPTIYLKDEEGNIYKSGDTINFTSYPAKLWLCAENINPNYIQYCRDMFLDSSESIYHYLKIYSEGTNSDSNSTEEENTKVTMHFNDSVPNAVDTPYENPFLVPRYPEDHTGYTNTLSRFTSILLDEGFMLYIMPSDYPYDGDEEEVSNYCTQAKQGTFRINDIFKDVRNQKESINPIGFPSSYFHIIFTPEQDGDEIKPFALDQSQARPIVIRKSDRWIGYTKIKGVNAVSPLSLSIVTITDDPTRFVFRRERDEDSPYTDTLTLSPEEVNEGLVVFVRPNDWEDNKMYVPFNQDKATLISRNVRVGYDDDPIYFIPLRCDIREEDIPHTDDPIVEEYEEETFSTYDYYCLLRVPEDCEEIKVAGFQVKTITEAKYGLHYVSVTESLYTDVEGGITVNNILDNVSSRIETAERATLGTTIDTSEHKYVLFKVNVFSGNDTTPLTGVRGILEVAHGSNWNKLIKMSYGNSSSQSSTISGDYPSSSLQNYLQVMTLPSWEGFNPSGVTGRLTDYYMASNIVEVPKLKEYKELPNGVFSGLQSLEDASFMQYMDSLTAIPPYAFAYCTELTSIVLPDNITSIGEGAFFGCENLREIVIPDSVTSIGHDAFYGCTSLVKVDFGAGISDLWGFGLITSDLLRTIVLRGRFEIPNTDPVEYRGVNLRTTMGGLYPVDFSDAIIRDNSNLVSIYVPTDLVDNYPNVSAWHQYFPNATFDSIDNLPTD